MMPGARFRQTYGQGTSYRSGWPVAIRKTRITARGGRSLGARTASSDSWGAYAHDGKTTACAKDASPRFEV